MSKFLDILVLCQTEVSISITALKDKLKDCIHQDCYAIYGIIAVGAAFMHNDNISNRKHPHPSCPCTHLMFISIVTLMPTKAPYLYSVCTVLFF